MSSTPSHHAAVARAFQDAGKDLFHRSPLYRGYCAGVLQEPRLLDMAADAMPGQPPMLMLFGAVHYLLLRGVEHPLGAIYRDIAARRPVEKEPFPLLVDFCMQHEEEVRRLIATGRVQTNEAGRAVFLRLGLEWIGHALGSAPVSYVEIGASAGFNLNWDRFSMRFEREGGSAWTRGEEGSPVQLRCVVEGLDLPAERGAAMPPIAERLGLDIEPLDIHDEQARDWLKAFIWADDVERLDRFAGVLEIARRHPVELLKADATQDLVGLCARFSAPRLCVAHTFLTSQLTEQQLGAMHAQLARLSETREVLEVSAEHTKTELRVRRWQHGRAAEDVLLAEGDPHARTMRWLHPT